MSASGAAVRLHSELAKEDALLAGALRAPDSDAAGPGGPAALAAAGPRTRARAEQYELLVEMIYEGYRLHYRDGRGVVVIPDDPDLALLLGDQLYALGLSRLAALGDLEAIGELADVISLVAQAHAIPDVALAEAVWEAGATAVGWGPSEAHREAKALARGGDPRARASLHAAARQIRGQATPER